mmetsp:Transcript_28007/g.110116  ORF Transcript_28007/g.110116 Transcript_28007/m.110116 type:complete len:100 (+) Transcript_28007:113-412(+)
MEDWWNDPKKNSRAPGRTGSDRERPQPERPGLERHQKSDMDWWNNPSTKATGQVLRQIIKTDKELIKKAADTASQEVSVATQVTAREAEALAKVAQSVG